MGHPRISERIERLIVDALIPLIFEETVDVAIVDLKGAHTSARHLRDRGCSCADDPSTNGC